MSGLDELSAEGEDRRGAASLDVEPGAAVGAE
jgi:hypothetical protein